MAKSDSKKSTNNSNVNKGLKYSTKNGLIMGTVIAVLVLIIVGYFAYFTGFFVKVIPAVKVEQTKDGTTKTVTSIYTPELNYYRNEILSLYSMYGMSVDMEYLQTMNESKGKTNGQLIYDQAAEEAMNVYLVNEYAKQDPKFVSGADRYAENDLYIFSLRAKNNNYPSVDQYLAAVYGTGMSSRVYKNIVAKKEMTQEYEQYVRQFAFFPSDTTELQKVYDSDPMSFVKADFNAYFFSNVFYPDGQALEMANAVADASTSSDTFNTALIEQLGVEYAYSIGLSVEGNESLVKDATKTLTEGDQYPEGTSEFVLNPENVGKAHVLDLGELGAYVFYLDKCTVDDANTYSIRKLILRNDAYEGLDDDEVPADATVAKGLENAKNEAAKIQSEVTDELSFANLVKKYTENYDDITVGGYQSGITADDFGAENIPADEKALGDWLLDPARKSGDMIIIASADNRTVTLFYYDSCMPAWMYTLAQEKVTEKVNLWSQNELDVQNTVPNISYSVAENLSYYAQ